MTLSKIAGMKSSGDSVIRGNWYAFSIGWMDRRFYEGLGSNWDDKLLRESVCISSAAATRLLDLGAGAGIVRELDFRPLDARIHGVDLDRRIAGNPRIDDACIGDAGALPYASGSFDAVVAANVLEHLPDPLVAFSEIQRVLKPGGRFHFKTPNRHHYVALLARSTPHLLHEKIANLRGRSEQDTFVTRYLANTTRRIRRLASMAGFEIEDLRLVEGRPEYCRIHPLLYIGGILYERLVNSTSMLASLRVVLIGTLRKPPA